MCAGGIHDSGSSPPRSSRSCRSQSALSVFARRLRPRLAAVSAGSARCTVWPGPPDLLGHKAPACRPLERELHRTAAEPPQPRTHPGARRRRDPATPPLTPLPVERPVADLVSMHIQRHHDPHRDPPSSVEQTPRDYHARAERVSLHVISPAKEGVGIAPARATSTACLQELCELAVAIEISSTFRAVSRDVACARECPPVPKWTRLVPARRPNFADAGNTIALFAGLLCKDL
jgi:hypothetical protein